ncbi:MAG TPA: GNAT family N-acetyltransferase [Acidimicrobiia bacterium]
MRDEDLLRRAYETLQGYYELGCEVIDDPLARFVRNVDAPRIYDVNFAALVRAATSSEIASVLERADEVFDGLPHRVFHIDPWTPPAFEAQLVLDGFEFEDELQLLLEDELRVPAVPPPVDMRLVESDEDWSIMRGLARLDHEEQARRRVHPLWDEEVTTEMVATKRAKAPDLRFWLARADGVDCAFLSSWPGANGVGKVEDLFTHPDFRHRAIATALIVNCVRDARARGAGPVLIGALPNDTPMHMYAAMGFRPFCVAHRGRKVSGS